MNKMKVKGQNVAECPHIWHYTDWVIPREIASKRECLLCKKKQNIDYLGGSMWRYRDE